MNIFIRSSRDPRKMANGPQTTGLNEYKKDVKIGVDLYVYDNT